MKKLVLAGLIIICAIVIVGSFFEPWAKANVSVTKVAKGLSSAAKEGALKDTPFAGRFVKGLDKATGVLGNLGDINVKAVVSGYDIPTLMNKKTSQVAVALLGIMFKDTKDLDKKSLLVYLLPLGGIACICLALLGLKKRLFVMIIAVISGVIAWPGLYNLMTANFSKLPVQISLLTGLWQTMYGYLLIFVFSVIWLVVDRKRKA